MERVSAAEKVEQLVRPTRIVCPTDGSAMEILAAREVRRYWYLRTGDLLPIVPTVEPQSSAGGGLAVGRKDRAALREMSGTPAWDSTLAGIGPQQYLLRTIEHGGNRWLLIVGGDDVGTLYGAYHLAERAGVRFYLHGDVVPDDLMRAELPNLDERGKPLFSLRGIQPFNNFHFGPDWWTTEDYKATISQLAKMRMNFIGFHCYPEYPGGWVPESAVWVGLRGEFDDKGQVRVGYPSRQSHTIENPSGGGLSIAMKTSDYRFGAAMLFDRDDAGSEAMAVASARQDPTEAQNEVFNHCGRMYREAFSFAHALGVKTCIGTEVPNPRDHFVMPPAVLERLRAQKKDPADPEVVREVYEAMFQRIMKTHPLDYYWLWTWEGWRGGNTPEELKVAVEHFTAAHQAIERVGAPFKLATCGWQLGPQEDRAAYDRLLPKDVAVSSINTELGHNPVDPAHARIQGREKWAIPWMEDDLALANPQLWVGRTRKDAADALAYGCTGLFGIHWRTRNIAPNFAALAQAGWSQIPWNPEPGKVPASVLPNFAESGPKGGQTAGFPESKIAGTDETTIYQTCRYGMSGYRFPVPAGKYRVTLKFCEPAYDAVGKRVFDVALQGKPILERFDIFARVGKFTALDLTYADVEAADGRLTLQFTSRVDNACISGIAIEGNGVTHKVNCGGPEYKDYRCEETFTLTPHTMHEPRGLTTADFYADWARANFGREAADKIAAIYERIDGNLPRVANGCPCNLNADNRPWNQVVKEYGFVDALAQCRERVKGAGNLARFDYWLDSLRYLRATAHLECAMGYYDQVMAKVTTEKDPAQRKELARTMGLPAYREVFQQYVEALGLLLQMTDTSGELGMVATWQHMFYGLATRNQGNGLSAALGEPLPADLQPTQHYKGPPRLIVPTIRSTAVEGDKLPLRIIVLAEQPPRDARLHWRTMGMGEYAAVDFQHVARGVYTVALPSVMEAGMEYYVAVTTGDGQQLMFPPTAPRLNQTVVALPMASGSSKPFPETKKP